MNSDELEILDVSTATDDAVGPSAYDTRSIRRSLPPPVRRARRRAAAGAAATVALLALLAGAAYTAWSVATVRHIDLVLAQAVAIDAGIREAESTFGERLLPDEPTLRADLDAELDAARTDLDRLARDLSDMLSPPDPRVAAYRGSVVQRVAAAAMDRGVALAGDEEITRARAAALDRWNVAGLLRAAPVAGEARRSVLSTGLTRRLPNADVLFDGECRCRLRAVVDVGGRAVAGVDVDISGDRHRLERRHLEPGDEATSLAGVATSAPFFQVGPDGETSIALRNGRTLTYSFEALGFPGWNEDALVLHGSPELGRPGAITLVDLDDGATRVIGGVDDRLLDIAEHHVLVVDGDSSEISLIETATLARTSWRPPTDVTFVEEASASPDGRSVAFAGVGSGGWGVAVVDGAGTARWLAHGDPVWGQRLSAVAWTPDGTWAFWLQDQLTGSAAAGRVSRWVRGAPADGSAAPHTLRQPGRYRAVRPVAG